MYKITRNPLPLIWLMLETVELKVKSLTQP